VFLSGKAHVDYRKTLNPLFTRQALDMYTHVMDSVARRYMSDWLADSRKDPSARPIMRWARQMNMETSLRVFVGQHISEKDMMEINDNYWDITTALELVNFPLPLPGTKIYRAKQASIMSHKHLEKSVAGCRASVAAGNEPECMVEQWIYDITRPSFKGRSDFNDREMAMVVWSFLFASQDAMSSAIIYGFQHLVDNPEILAKVRAEQTEVRKGDFTKPTTMDMIDNSPYLRAVVRESMRVKPPVTMIPYKTTKAFPIREDYTVPPGSLVIPSFYNSLHDPEVYEDPDRFYPERWLDEASKPNQNPKNYLCFGAGPHRCIGEQYANSNTALVLATAAIMCDWEHVLTPESQEVE
jgi:C-22 sterol desaturase